MVSDSELIERLREFLLTSDLNTTTTAIVRRKLEEDFRIDLTEKKAFIRQQVDLFLQSQQENEKEEEEEREEEEAKNGKAEADGTDSEEDEGDEEEEQEEDVGRNAKKKKKKTANKDRKDNKRRGGGFTKLCSLSPQLQEFVGVAELSRTEVVKQLWAYIREKKLQDPENRRNIICDATLHTLFGVNSINMFQMNKVLSKHIWPLDEAGPAKSEQKEKQRKQEREEGSDELKPKEKKRKGSSGFLAPLPLSDALVRFIGTGESSLSRSDVVKRMWDYIKQNNLQDPADKRRIKCDEKLKELFEVDSFNGFTVPKLLTSHFIKAEQ
ncbi:upstream activation factor subunit spp27-like isoform X1 [Aristolochia californica]|uniref:upstream activation factor subunit spp27-like isoform X1 n=1 Tax=Aristolochia californica TaxID=171875 RepID=UPI0035D7D575